jgi:hypothetical protein
MGLAQQPIEPCASPDNSICMGFLQSDRRYSVGWRTARL